MKTFRYPVAKGGGARDTLQLMGLHAVAQLVRPLVRPQKVQDGSPKVLLIRPDHIGDVLFTTPSLHLLRASLPEARITYLVGTWSREVVEGNPDVDQVLTFPFPGFTRRPKGSPLAPYRALLELAGVLRQQQFDIAVNLRFDFWWGAMLAHLSGIPQRIGYDVPGCRPFLTDSAPHLPRCHQVQRNLRLVSLLTGGWQETSPEGNRCYPLVFSVTEEDVRFADDFLRAHGVGPEDTLVDIHPGTGGYVKRWRADGYAAVADQLHRQYGAKIIITGSRGEEELARDIEQRIGTPAVAAVGRTALGQLAALLRRCRLSIGVDSGPLHLAVAMGTPTVHLFGPSDHVAFGPYGDPHRHIVVRSGWLCSPCDKLDFAPEEAVGHDCVRAIETETVLAAAEQALQA